MRFTRILGCLLSVCTVVASVAVALVLGHSTPRHAAAITPSPSPSSTGTESTGMSATASSTGVDVAPTPTTVSTSSSAARPKDPHVVSATTRIRAVPASAQLPVATPSHTARPTRWPVSSAPQRGASLPLGYGTGNATRVLTVTAGSTGSTTATLQAWQQAPGGGWLRYGGAVLAHIGSQGMTSSPSESLSATPMGSFTLTQAFGRLSNPGTSLPYFQTTPADYWISDWPSSVYNTHQRCPSSNPGCYDDGTNERLYYETPYYNYAVVIDYNTRNAPGGVHQGKGSAFFLHVTDGTATAGCVAIPQSTLVSIMQWLAPSTHPRILIGTV